VTGSPPPCGEPTARPRVVPRSRRLVYRPVLPADAADFLRLLRDPHIRAYLLDGAVVDGAFSARAIADSERLVAECGVGLWLVSGRKAGTAPIGFCGFRRFPGLGDGPQLLYALLPEATGRGLATEMGLACVAAARAAGLAGPLRAAVDAPNRAAARVLAKLGFRPVGETSGGAFGTTQLYELPASGGS